MPSGPSPDDDDDDSIYSGEPLPRPASGVADDTVLNPSSPQTIQLDKRLDDDDAQHLRDNPHLADSDYDSDIILSSDDDDTVDHKQTSRATRIDILSSPPRYPDAPGLDDDLQISAEGLDSENTLTGRFEKQLEINSGSEDALDRSEDVVVLDADDEDDWFDSDENNVDVESLESSDESTDVPLDDAITGTPSASRQTATALKENGAVGADRIPESLHNEKQRPSGGGGGGAYSMLTRASQTFYKAFKKTAKKPSGASSSNGNAGGKTVGAGIGEVGKGPGSGREDGLRHERMIQLLDAQIATLNGARTGFVDLNLLKPMTEKTVETIEGEGKALLGDYAGVEKRCREMEKERAKVGREGEAELEAKEQMLINAKMRLAEAHAEVDGLRHELRTLQRSLEAPERVEARMRAERRKRREGVEGELVATREARFAAEERLEGQRSKLKMEEEQLERLEKGYRDIEGDWA